MFQTRLRACDGIEPLDRARFNGLREGFAKSALTALGGDSKDSDGPAHLARAGITPEQWFKAFYLLGLEAYAIDELSGECRRAHQQNLAAVESINILFCRPNSKPAARIRI